MAKQTAPKEDKAEIVQPIILGKTEITVAGVILLREMTEDEALEYYKGKFHDSRIINAWKIANKKK